jgi:hypothetical protein
VEEIRWQALEAGRGVVQGNGSVRVSDELTERGNAGAGR